MSLLNRIHQIISFATDKGVTGYRALKRLQRELL